MLYFLLHYCENLLRMYTLQLIEKLFIFQNKNSYKYLQRQGGQSEPAGYDARRYRYLSNDFFVKRARKC